MNYVQKRGYFSPKTGYNNTIIQIDGSLTQGG